MRCVHPLLLVASLAITTATDAGTPCLCGGHPGARVIKQTDDYVYFSIAVTVTNKCGSDVRAVAKIQAVDKDGFELNYTYIEGPVGIGDSAVISGVIVVEKSVASQIARWKVNSLRAR